PRAKGAKGGGVKGLRRDAPVGAESGYRLRAGDGGQRYEIMADTVPGRPSKCPPFRRNAVRHAVGTVSAISSESCPPWPGTRSLADLLGPPAQMRQTILQRARRQAFRLPPLE